jgi:lipopolysaccharide export system permease protein
VLFAAAGAVVLPVAVLAAWVAFVDGPVAAREAVAMRLSALRTAVTRGLSPGSFRAIGDGATLHFTARDEDGTLRGVFVLRDLPDDGAGRDRIQVLTAQSARYQVNAAGDAIEVELIDGQSHEGAPGALDWRVTTFRRQLLRLPAPQARLPGPPRTDLLGNLELLASDQPRHVAELHWRIGWVAAVLVLGFVAVPLARLSPRQGRHARMPWAVLLFAVHAGLLTSGRNLLERGETPPVLGLWWVHAVVLLLALGVFGLPRLSAALARRHAAP